MGITAAANAAPVAGAIIERSASMLGAKPDFSIMADPETLLWLVSTTMSRFSPRAAMMEAAPSVGPTQGLHTAPSSSPTPNYPGIPEVEKPAKRLASSR